jgi:hypothetical protein
VTARLRRGGGNDCWRRNCRREYAAGWSDATGTLPYGVSDTRRVVLDDGPRGTLAKHHTQELALVRKGQLITHERGELLAEQFQVVDVGRLRRQVRGPTVGDWAADRAVSIQSVMAASAPLMLLPGTAHSPEMVAIITDGGMRPARRAYFRFRLRLRSCMATTVAGCPGCRTDKKTDWQKSRYLPRTRQPRG